jgi:hypothetical protein
MIVLSEEEKNTESDHSRSIYSTAELVKPLGNRSAISASGVIAVA